MTLPGQRDRKGQGSHVVPAATRYPTGAPRSDEHLSPELTPPPGSLESAESLGTFLRTKIGTIEGVQRTETFVNLAIKKRTYGLVL